MRSGRLCPGVANPDLVLCGNRQAIQARPDHPNRVVSPSSGFPVDMHQVAPTRDVFITRFNSKLPHVTSSRLPSLGIRCTQSTLGEPGPIRLPTNSHSGQSGETKELPMQENHPDCPRVAQHALVLRSGRHVKPDPSLPAKSADNQILHKNLSNINIDPLLLEPQ